MAQTEGVEPTARELRPGDNHYTAYVGPPAEYDTMGATQFRLLTTLGLRAHHRLLDYGCGSLRAGRLFIPYLESGHYFGLEPSEWLVKEALEREIGQDIVAVKQPTFLHHDTFGTREFGVPFDFVLAQSILSHTGSDIVESTLRGIGEGLVPGGLALVTFVEALWPRPSENKKGWVYPGNVRFRPADIRKAISNVGLYSVRLRWHHPRQRWYALATEAQYLPPLEARLQRGAVYPRPMPTPSRRFRTHAIRALTDRIPETSAVWKVYRSTAALRGRH